jgi:hypothetical protein
VNRRTFLRSMLVGGSMVSVVGVGGWLIGHRPRSADLVARSECTGPSPTPAATPHRYSPLPEARWPGHQPGRVYLGVSGSTASLDGYKCLLRAFRSYFDWEEPGDEDAAIRTSHRLGRLPWVSFKPPINAAQGWSQIAAGDHDDAIRARARRYAAYAQPIVSTFHHEPTNEPAGTGSDFAAAWTHIHDVMLAESDLANVAFVPVIGSWEWNPKNVHADPDPYLTTDVLSRAAFLGLDVYEGASGETFSDRMDLVLAWLDQRGYADLMVGIGEMGCTEQFTSTDAAQWWTDSWAWIEAHADRVGVVCYFNSTANSRESAYWPLDESQAKSDAFIKSLESPVVSAPL